MLNALSTETFATVLLVPTDEAVFRNLFQIGVDEIFFVNEILNGFLFLICFSFLVLMLIIKIDIGM